jgi:uncharacterized protein YkwD
MNTVKRTFTPSRLIQRSRARCKRIVARAAYFVRGSLASFPATHRIIWQFGLLCCLSLGAALASAGGDNGKQFKPTPNEQKVFELTNAERKKEDVAVLKWSDELSKIARAHSENMARQKKMDHVLDGKSPFDRIKATGMTYYYAGENVAWGPDNVGIPAVMVGWMNSEKHRENILSKDFTDIGIGIARNADGQIYFTQVFAKPKKK